MINIYHHALGWRGVQISYSTESAVWCENKLVPCGKMMMFVQQWWRTSVRWETDLATSEFSDAVTYSPPRETVSIEEWQLSYFRQNLTLDTWLWCLYQLIKQDMICWLMGFWGDGSGVVLPTESIITENRLTLTLRQPFPWCGFIFIAQTWV